MVVVRGRQRINAAVVVLGENLNSYLFKKERREFFHPEIQAELEFGLEQSKSASAKEMLENLSHFFKQDAEWDAADKAIVALRSGLTQHTLATTKELADAVAAEFFDIPIRALERRLQRCA